MLAKDRRGAGAHRELLNMVLPEKPLHPIKANIILLISNAVAPTLLQ